MAANRSWKMRVRLRSSHSQPPTPKSQPALVAELPRDCHYFAIVGDFARTAGAVPAEPGGHAGGDGVDAAEALVAGAQQHRQAAAEHVLDGARELVIDGFVDLRQ